MTSRQSSGADNDDDDDDVNSATRCVSLRSDDSLPDWSGELCTCACTCMKSLCNEYAQRLNLIIYFVCNNCMHVYPFEEFQANCIQVHVCTCIYADVHVKQILHAHV